MVVTEEGGGGAAGELLALGCGVGGEEDGVECGDGEGLGACGEEVGAEGLEGGEAVEDGAGLRVVGDGVEVVGGGGEVVGDVLDGEGVVEEEGDEAVDEGWGSWGWRGGGIVRLHG